MVHPRFRPNSPKRLASWIGVPPEHENGLSGLTPVLTVPSHPQLLIVFVLPGFTIITTVILYFYSPRSYSKGAFLVDHSYEAPTWPVVAARVCPYNTSRAGHEDQSREEIGAYAPRYGGCDEGPRPPQVALRNHPCRHLN